MTARPGPLDAARDERVGAARETVTLVLFEAAGILMAVPAAEVWEVRARDLAPPDEPATVVDLGARFGTAPASGPWLGWRRAATARWLRVEEVRDVVAYRLRDLTPLPARVGRAGPFWAAAVHGNEVVLLIDPARM